MKTYTRVLSIAGSDPSGGAGLQADIKAISACGGYAMTAITAVIDQNTLGVRRIEPVSPDMVQAQIVATISDIGVNAIKIGLLPNQAIMTAVADTLRQLNPNVPIVLDPVMVATSGDDLMNRDALNCFKQHLLPLATVVTPNMPEADALNDQLPGRYWLLKGGHAESDTLIDRLCYATDNGLQTIKEFAFPKINTPNTHGTGCTLSSALATFLAKGMDIREATSHAETYLHDALNAGKDFSIGHGHGPVNHFFMLS